MTAASNPKEIAVRYGRGFGVVVKVERGSGGAKVELLGVTFTPLGPGLFVGLVE
jgi:glutathione synthase/RimK-type ligase-like ATP-grasp enzyme